MTFYSEFQCLVLSRTVLVLLVEMIATPLDKSTVYHKQKYSSEFDRHHTGRGSDTIFYRLSKSIWSPHESKQAILVSCFNKLKDCTLDRMRSSKTLIDLVLSFTLKFIFFLKISSRTILRGNLRITGRVLLLDQVTDERKKNISCHLGSS